MVSHDEASASDNLVPEPQTTIFDSVNRAVGDERTARQIFANPQLAGTLDAQGTGSGSTRFGQTMQGTSSATGEGTVDVTGGDTVGGTVADNAGDGAANGDDGSITLQAVDDIGRATAMDVREALHQVIDPELGIDVIDLGLVYGIEIDAQGRAIITMTLTTPACPLTDLIEDECASTLAGLVEEFRIDWTWEPLWTTDKITPEGRDQLAAIGFNLENMPRY